MLSYSAPQGGVLRVAQQQKKGRRRGQQQQQQQEQVRVRQKNKKKCFMNIAKQVLLHEHTLFVQIFFHFSKNKAVL